jgi:hypothetical protein
MHRVEFRPAMTALFAEHGAAVSTSAQPSRAASPFSSFILPIPGVSIMCPTGLPSAVGLLRLLLTGPAGR